MRDLNMFLTNKNGGANSAYSLVTLPRQVIQRTRGMARAVDLEPLGLARQRPFAR